MRRPQRRTHTRDFASFLPAITKPLLLTLALPRIEWPCGPSASVPNREADLRQEAPLINMINRQGVACAPIGQSNDDTWVPDPSILTPPAGQSGDLQGTTKLEYR